VFCGEGMFMTTFAVGKLPYCPLATGGICIDQINDEIFLLDQKQIMVFHHLISSMIDGNNDIMLNRYMI
jgi:hypothetical protein